MIERVFKLGVLASAIQVIVFWLLLTAFKYSGPYLFDKNPSYIPKSSVVLTMIVFTAIVVFQNISTAIINNRTVTRVAFALAVSFYVFNWGANYRIWPVQTVIFLSIGVAVLLLKFALDRLLRSRNPAE